ncbi:hypothetical protein [Pontibacillus chungwhensis]|uniref:hypothetical protein n=1 Tax=Pontibacillus chungwhensis TaxID=265426 RepID=UPI000A46976F|nr:hypothetical protein [Pontibacillus chungwhensis]
MLTILSKCTEAFVLFMLGISFVGYAVFVYPFEKLHEKTNREVKANQLKYAPNA